MTALTREKKHAVVASLARGRSVAMTAERCRRQPHHPLTPSNTQPKKENHHA